MSGYDDEVPVPLGTVVEQDRGSLPFALIHGESLVAAAAWALGEAGVQAVDLSVTWEAVREAGAPFVLHDSLCPMTPPGFIAECVARAVSDDVVVVAVRPVTDTVKRLVRGDGGSVPDAVGGTLDRDELVSVCSPVVLPAAVVARLDALPSLDFAVLASLLTDLGSGAHPVVQVPAPTSARRVASPDDVVLLQALTGPLTGPLADPLSQQPLG